MSFSKSESSFFIPSLPLVRAPTSTLYARGIETLERMNNDMQRLNSLIDEYNHAQNRTDRIQKLKQLDALCQFIDDGYNDDEVAFFPDYQKIIYTALQEALIAQRAVLYLDSNYKSKAAFVSDSGRELSDVIDTMSTEDVAQIMQLLSTGKRRDLRKQLAQIAPGNSAYQIFLIQHDIEFIGGGNSRNFVFVNRASQQRILLKLENSLGNSKKPERELRAAMKDAENKSNFLVRQWSDRRAAFRDPETNAITIRRLTVMDYSIGTIVNDMPLETDLVAQQNLAVDMALAQIMIYKKMHLLNKTWTDGKTENILFHRDPQTQTMIGEIADCKAIYDCDPRTGKIINSRYASGTPFASAPEYTDNEAHTVDVDRACVYTIGKNLYESLLRFAPHAYKNYFKPNAKGRAPYEVNELSDKYFNHEIFAEPFKSLIQSMTRADPAARISDDKLFSQLLDIKFAQHPEHEQYQQACQKIEQILAFDLETEEQQQRREFVFKCYEILLNPQPDLGKLNRGLERVLQRYQARQPTTIYKEALDSQKKSGDQMNVTKGLDSK